MVVHKANKSSTRIQRVRWSEALLGGQDVSDNLLLEFEYCSPGSEGWVVAAASILDSTTERKGEGCGKSGSMRQLILSGWG